MVFLFCDGLVTCSASHTVTARMDAPPQRSWLRWMDERKKHHIDESLCSKCMDNKPRRFRCVWLSSRSTHDLVAMDGWLYAVGGNDGSSSLNSIEKYNPRSNKWVAASCMFTRRSSVGVAVLELLNFPPPSSPTLSVSSTSLWHEVTAWLNSASAATAQTGSGKRRNCSVWDGEDR